jgi:hypothetical protein
MSYPTKIDEPALAAYRQRVAAKVAEIKGAILKWLEPRDNVGDSVCITNALFEIALDRHGAILEADGFELIEAAYQRALKRSRAHPTGRRHGAVINSEIILDRKLSDKRER